MLIGIEKCPNLKSLEFQLNPNFVRHYSIYVQSVFQISIFVGQKQLFHILEVSYKHELLFFIFFQSVQTNRQNVKNTISIPLQSTKYFTLLYFIIFIQILFNYSPLASMKQQSVNINNLAFKKIIFHCLRYPSSKVYGALIKSSNNQITNAYPLFHSALVGPTLSLALDLVQSNLQSGQQIGGFYEYIQQGGQSVISRIIESNQQLKGMSVIRITCRNKNFEFSNQDKSQVIVPEFNTIEQDLVEGKHRLIVDMDAHLDAIQLDFRNTYVK